MTSKQKTTIIVVSIVCFFLTIVTVEIIDLFEHIHESITIIVGAFGAGMTALLGFVFKAKNKKE